jgi:hypothetical protein
MFSMSRNRLMLAAVVVAVSMAALLATRASPALADDPYTGVDFVFLIDQSGSMCGAPCQSTIETRNDPQGFRFEGPRFAIIDFLGDQMSEIYASSTARISIVEFGQDVDVSTYQPGANTTYDNIAIHDVLPITTIESDRDAWQVQREQLLQRMTDYQVERETKNLGNTDHLGAVRRAVEVLNQMQASDGSRRLKVVVLLTDGQSAVCYPRGPQNDPWADQSCIGPGQILPQVQSEIEANLQGEDYAFYVVGMADASSNYWTNNGPFWENLAAEHQGEARLVESQNEVAQFMGEIVNAALSKLALPPAGPGVITEWLPQLGDFSVRPYLQSLTFYIIRTTPTDTVDIYDPQNQALDLNLADGDCQNDVCYYALGRLIDKVVVSRPEPGKWRAEATIPTTESLYNTVRIGTRSLLFAPQLVKPVAGRYPQGVPLDVQIAMLDLDGQPVPQYPDNLYALNATASVIAADGQGVAQTPLDPGTFSGQVAVNQTGEAFQIHLDGTTRTPDGEEFQVLDHDLDAGFSIEPLTGGLVPPQGLLQQREATLSYQVDVDRFQDLADGYHYVGQFELTPPNSGTPVILPATEDGASGVFSAPYKPESAGTYALDFELFVVNEATGEQSPVPLDLAPDSQGQFDVAATKGLDLVLIQPANGSQQVKRNWLLQIAPMRIEVGLVDRASGEPVNWADVQSGATASALSIDVRDPEGQPRGTELRSAAIEGDTVRFEGDGFAQSGPWTITLPGDVQFKDEYVLADTSPSVTVMRVENYPAWGAWGIAALGLLVVFGWRVNRYRVRHSGPHLIGHLEILDENDIPLAGGIKSLPTGVNQHTFSDLPSSTGIKKLQVRFVSSDAVEVMVDGVPTTIMHETEWDSGRDFKIKYVNPTLE